jgi:Carboxypeptidase regulatory-like domain
VRSSARSNPNAPGWTAPAWRSGRARLGRTLGVLAAVTVALALGLAATALAAEGGTITGTVISAAAKAPIAGIEVCAYQSGSEEVEELFGQCTQTSAEGEYSIQGLTAGEYMVEFFAPFAGSLNYVTQYFQDASSPADATPVNVVANSVDTGIDAELEQGGQITGSVTDASTSAAIEGIEVCASATHGAGFGCGLTNAGGEYTITSLPSDEYEVEFYSPTSQLNYVTQYYDGALEESAATPVTVTVGDTTSSIDAQLQHGGEIAGQVTDAATGSAAKNIRVCALITAKESSGCAATNSSGEYLISALPGGEYKVGFDGGKDYAVQYYNDKFSFAEAQGLEVVVNDTIHGIDAAMTVGRPIAPTNGRLPVISGTPAVGDTLTCTTGLWAGSPTPTLSEQWTRDGALIPGASGASYRVQGADEGHTLACEVTASSSSGEQSATSTGIAVPASTLTSTTTTTSTSSTSTPTPSASTNGTPAPPSSALPDVVLGSGVVVSRGSALVHLKCSNASCQGIVELEVQVLTKRHAGKLTISHRETVLLGKASFSLAQGKSGVVVLRLTAAGRNRLAHAKRHPVAAELSLAVVGVKATVKALLVT